jgi:hypothetical protein
LDKFIARYRALVTGVLSGFDRLVFRGSLLPLVRDGGMFFFLERAGIRLLDFKSFVLGTSERVKAAAFAQANRLGRPVRYLESSATDKEQLTRLPDSSCSVTPSPSHIFPTSRLRRDHVWRAST